MPSVSRPYAPAGLAAGLALVLCGCTTTETTAARLQLNDARLRASAAPVRVAPGRVSTAVLVSSVTPLRTGRAVVVMLKNRSETAVSDLPISVGYRLGSRTVYLNATAGLSYFNNHIPAIPAHQTLSWVYTGEVSGWSQSARYFARVGSRASPGVGSFSPPVIDSTVRTQAPVKFKQTASTPRAGTKVVAVQLSNRSSIPQYQLPVYALVLRGHRVVAAKASSVSDLAGGGTLVLHLALPIATLGDGASLQVQAPATIFR